MNSLMMKEIIAYGSRFWQCAEKSENIIMYGAGEICRKCISLFDRETVKKIKHIAVTSLENNVHDINGIAVSEIDALKEEKGAAIIIAVRGRFISEIRELLNKMKFEKILIADYDKLKIFKIYRDLGGVYKEISADNCLTEAERAEEIYKKALNVGYFIGNSSAAPMEFREIAFTWGGSGILDYALLRGLILKYHLRTYLEIGTYIGDSLKAVSDLVRTCYSISVPETHPAHMKTWCKGRHINDYSNKLVNESHMIQFLEDSKNFDFHRIEEKIDLYFIDGDHSYWGVFLDSLKVFNHLDTENSFVVWHDCRKAAGVNMEVLDAIQDAIGDYFKNFYIFDNCMCGIYIPDKYRKDFVLADEKDKLITYRVIMQKNENEL